MKKNKMMRIASVLLVAVLLSTCAISGTFAKYVTSDSAKDTARVAKWGVALQVTGKLFGETYKDAIVADDDNSFTVQAKDFSSEDEDDYVVAPGTASSDGFKISLTGTPEVATKVDVTIKAQNIFLIAGTYGLMVQVPDDTVTEVNFSSLGDLYTLESGTYTKAGAWSEGTTYYTLEDAVDTTTLGTYYPVVFAMTGDTEYTGDASEDTINEIAAALAAKFGQATVTENVENKAITNYTVTSTTVNPNTDLDTTFKVDDIAITWAWSFDSDDNAQTITTEDMADTILGLLMTRANAGTDALDGTVVKLTVNDTYATPKEYTDYCLDVSFDVEITVTQVD